MTEYTEILFKNGSRFDEHEQANLGRMVINLLEIHGKPVIVRGVDDIDKAKPWATDNDTNVNRRGKGQ